MIKNMRPVPLAFTLVVAACASPAEKQARQEQAARVAIAAESSSAAAARSLPSTGRWDEPHLVERLVRAGLAPRAKKDEKGEAFWKVPVLAYQVGPSLLYVYLYPDSASRRAVTATLDTVNAAPPGRTGVYPLPHIMIVQNNLAAVMVGGSDTQQERVRLALEAGLPAPPRR